MTHDLQAPLRGNFVFLRAGNLRLVLPQSQVGAAQYLEARPQAGKETGLLQLPGDEMKRAFVALSHDMTLLPVIPEDRFVFTTIDGNEGLGWCWSELQVMIDVELQPRTLPAVLAAPGMAVSAWVEHAGEPAFLCEAERLQHHALASRS